MKKIIISIGLIAIVLVGYVAAGPFITMYKMKSAAENHQVGKLAQTIDFPRLRANLKNQINDKLTKESTSLTGSKKLAVLAAGLITDQAADKVVNQLVTPIAIGRLMDGLSAGKEILKEPQESSDKQPQTEPFKRTRWTYDSTDSFSIWVKSRKDDAIELRFILEREGLDWKLTNIILPLS